MLLMRFLPRWERIRIPSPVGRCFISHAFPLPCVLFPIVPRVSWCIYLGGGVVPPIVRCSLEFRRIVAPVLARRCLSIAIGGAGVASPPPPSAVVSGVSVFDSPVRVVVGVGSSPPAVDVTAGVGALKVNAGWQIAPPPGGGFIPRALRTAF